MQLNADDITSKRVMQIAWPIIVANITIPLLGLVDTAVVGNLGNAALIGAIAIGSMVFGFFYWGFGFLRMSTTGLVAQADGAGDPQLVQVEFYRALLLALVIAVLLLCFQVIIIKYSLILIDASQQVESAAQSYLGIRILSAPATLLNFVIIGFFLGLGKTRITLVLQVLMNGLNIVLDLVFVLLLGWGVEGVALATVIAEYVVLMLGLVLAAKYLSSSYSVDFSRLFASKEFRKMLSLNSDLMLRTLCLLFVFAWFTNQSAKLGDDLLAANSILLQFITFTAFVLDGFALAAERLVGQAVGARHYQYFRRSVYQTSLLAFLMSVMLMLVVWLAHGVTINIMTNVETVRVLANDYIIWVVIAPLLSFTCFQLDGIFIGATRSAEMRNSMLVTVILFLISWYVLMPRYGNHGLWMALWLSYAFRSLTLYWFYPDIKKLFM